MLIMGSGNTKSGQQKDEKLAVNDEKQLEVKPRKQDDNLINKRSNQEKNKNLSKTNESTREETKGNEEKKSKDSDDEELQPVEDIKLKLSERGFSDPTLISHCEKTPKYLEYFISIYEAVKSIEERLKEEDILSIQRQAMVISSSYSKVKRKTALGDFLAEIGFARIFKDFYLKLDSAFPELLTYDRELDENLKKPSAVGNESSNTKEVKNPDQHSSNKPTESSDKTTESGNNPNISSNKPSETSVTTAKLKVEPTEASVDNVKANNQVEARAHDTPAKPAQAVEVSSSVAGPNEQPNEGPGNMQPTEKTKDCVQHANSSDLPIESNSDKPTNDEQENIGDQTKVLSVRPAHSSNQPEQTTVTENTDKPTDVQEVRILSMYKQNLK